MLTMQETFDKVATHLLTQNSKSLSDTGTCRYRGKNGKKCAIGCLIPDDKYYPHLEGRDIYNPLILNVLEGEVNVMDPSTRDMLGDLQVTHDAITPYAWKSDLFRIAAKYELNTNAIR